MARLFYVYNTFAADNIVKQGTEVSGAMVLAWWFLAEYAGLCTGVNWSLSQWEPMGYWHNVCLNFYWVATPDSYIE